MKMHQPKPKSPLRPSKPFFERVKLPLIIVFFLAANEWASPFRSASLAPLAWTVLALIILVIREFHHARLEVNEDWATKTAEVSRRVRLRTALVSRQSWLKVQRVATWALTLYFLGMAINTLTPRCSSPAQCIVLAPKLAIENLPMMIQYAL